MRGRAWKGDLEAVSRGYVVMSMTGVMSTGRARRGLARIHREIRDGERLFRKLKIDGRDGEDRDPVPDHPFSSTPNASRRRYRVLRSRPRMRAAIDLLPPAAW